MWYNIFNVPLYIRCWGNILTIQKGCISASFPQIYSNNKKGRESDKSDPKKL